MGLFDIFKKSYTTNTIKKLCEIIRPTIGDNYSDATSTQKYRSWVYVASTYNAKSVADCELKLFANTKPKVSRGRPVTKKELKEIKSYGLKAMDSTNEIESHPIIDLLNSPNNEDTLYSLIYKTDLYLELTGDAYWYIERAQNGIPVAIYVLYSQYVNIQHDGNGNIIKYNYGVRQNNVWQYSFEPDEIIHFKLFDPNDIYHGISPLQACARSYGLIESMDTHEQALNRNLGIPSGILKYTNAKISQKDRELIESKWNQKFAGVGRSGKVVVTDQDIDYQTLGITPREMNFIEGRKWSREEIMSCYGIPTGLLTTEATNYSNMITSTINYHQKTLKPRLKMISQTITKQLINKNGLNGKDLVVVLRVEPPTNEETEIKKSELMVKAGAVTIDELRQQMSLEPVKGGDQLVNIRGVNSEEQD